LQKASAVLIALVYSLSQALDSEQAGDVASVALDLIEQAVAALDSVQLARPEPDAAPA
jgi:cyanate lyase